MSSGSYGTSWADQWDYGSDPPPSSSSSSSGKRSGGGGGGGGKKGGGVEKTKAAAASGLRKVKEGTAHGFQWIKDKYQQKKSGGKKHGDQQSSEIAGY